MYRQISTRLDLKFSEDIIHILSYAKIGKSAFFIMLARNFMLCYRWWRNQIFAQSFCCKMVSNSLLWHWNISEHNSIFNKKITWVIHSIFSHAPDILSFSSFHLNLCPLKLEVIPLRSGWSTYGFTTHRASLPPPPPPPKESIMWHLNC